MKNKERSHASLNECIFYYRSHILQADSAEIMNAWIIALHNRIDAAIQESKEGDGTINTFNVSIPVARRIQKMYVNIKHVFTSKKFD